MNTPLVSVIIPAYNCEKYIKRCIEAVLSQTYKNIEIIVVNDGSTDGTELVCLEYTEYIVYAYQKNAGPSAARNKGIDLAKGEYITFADADDYMNTDYIQTLIELIEKYNVKIAMCSYFKADNTTKVVGPKRKKVREIIISADDALCNLFYKKKIMPYAFLKLYSAEIICGQRFPLELHLGEDLQFVYELLHKGYSVAYTDKELYVYCQNETSITHTFNANVANAHWGQMRCILNEASGELRKAVISRMFVVAYDFLSQMPKDEYESLKTELIQFINSHKKAVMLNRKNKFIVRGMAFLSKFSIRCTVNLCNKGKEIAGKQFILKRAV